MRTERIEEEMKKLESKLEYKFNDISWLEKAMKSVKIKDIPNQGKNGKEYSNETLATVGDTILKFVITDKLFKENESITKGELTDFKKTLESNKTLHKIMIEEHLIDYAYNDSNFHKDSKIKNNEKVVDKKHDPYLEAIIGAIYYDSKSDFVEVRNWINEWLFPRLEKYSKK